jgi:hypothetical protein
MGIDGIDCMSIDRDPCKGSPPVRRRKYTGPIEASVWRYMEMRVSFIAAGSDPGIFKP